MSVGATQAEIHAPAQIRFCPVRPIRSRGEACIEKRAVDVRIALDRVALVEMGMNVDQSRPDLTAADIDARNAVIALPAGRSMRASLPSSTSKSAFTHAFRIDPVSAKAMLSANKRRARARSQSSSGAWRARRCQRI